MEGNNSNGNASEALIPLFRVRLKRSKTLVNSTRFIVVRPSFCCPCRWFENDDYE